MKKYLTLNTEHIPGTYQNIYVNLQPSHIPSKEENRFLKSQYWAQCRKSLKIVCLSPFSERVPAGSLICELNLMPAPQVSNISKWAFFYFKSGASIWICAKLCQSCLTLCDPMDSSPPGSSVCGILQARILEWVAMPSSREFSLPRDQTCISCTDGGYFTTSVTWEALICSWHPHFRGCHPRDTSWSPGSGGQMSLCSWSCVAVIFRVTQKEACGLPREHRGKESAC